VVRACNLRGASADPGFGELTRRLDEEMGARGGNGELQDQTRYDVRMRAYLFGFLFLGAACDSAKPPSTEAICTKMKTLCGSTFDSCLTERDWHDAERDVGPDVVVKFKTCIGKADSCEGIFGECVVELGSNAGLFGRKPRKQ